MAELECSVRFARKENERQKSSTPVKKFQPAASSYVLLAQYFYEIKSGAEMGSAGWRWVILQCPLFALGLGNA